MSWERICEEGKDPWAAYRHKEQLLTNVQQENWDLIVPPRGDEFCQQRDLESGSFPRWASEKTTAPADTWMAAWDPETSLNHKIIHAYCPRQLNL